MLRLPLRAGRWRPSRYRLQCGAVVRTVPAGDVEKAVPELAQTDTVSSTCCTRTHCGAHNAFPSFSVIEAFTCPECGEAPWSSRRCSEAGYATPGYGSEVRSPRCTCGSTAGTPNLSGHDHAIANPAVSLRHPDVFPGVNGQMGGCPPSKRARPEGGGPSTTDWDFHNPILPTAISSQACIRHYRSIGFGRAKRSSGAH